MWACNAPIVDVYRRCQLTYVGMAGACIGLSATEARAACRDWRQYRRLWPDLRAMGDAAAEWINARAKG